jgi:hypothetical protein
MLDLNERLELLQANIDALPPGPSRDELQSDLELVVAVIDALPHRIAEAVSWQDAREAGSQRARMRFIEATCKAFEPPPKH